MSEDKKVIFSMVGVTKSTPQGKQIIKNIHLSFFIIQHFKNKCRTNCLHKYGKNYETI